MMLKRVCDTRDQDESIINCMYCSPEIVILLTTSHDCHLVSEPNPHRVCPAQHNKVNNDDLMFGPALRTVEHH